MRNINSNSFEFFEPDQIDQADVVEQFVSNACKNSNLKAGWETWTCAWAPRNSFFAWSCGQRLVRLIPWDNISQKRHGSSDEGLKGRCYHLIDCCEPVWSLAFGSGLSETEQLGKCYLRCRIDRSLVLATGHASGKIKLWDCHSGALIIELLDHRAIVRSLEFTKDGSLQLLSASQDGTVKLWDLDNDGNMYHTFKLPGVRFHGCSLSPNGKWIAAVGTNRSAVLWKMSDIKDAPIRLSGHHNEVVNCAFSPDSALLATASFDTKVILWNTDTFQQVKVLSHLHPSPSLIFAGGANDHYVRDVSFSPNGLILGTVCDDGYVRMWNLNNTSNPVAISSIADVISIAFSAGGGAIAVGCRNGDVHVLSSPSRVASLKDMCRMTIRKHTKSTDCDALPLPRRLVKYLQFEEKHII